MTPQCIACKNRPAISRFRGIHKYRKDHPMCRQCYSSLLESIRQNRIANRSFIETDPPTLCYGGMGGG